ncbi:hypothetical protein GBA52_021395 [Prunus armeniaca]|nr:hypothetical protein GBA52_021395 [Prunus armeniaca]
MRAPHDGRLFGPFYDVINPTENSNFFAGETKARVLESIEPLSFVDALKNSKVRNTQQHQTQNRLPHTAPPNATTTDNLTGIRPLKIQTRQD